jgi:hypothetical protein
MTKRITPAPAAPAAPTEQLWDKRQLARILNVTGGAIDKGLAAGTVCPPVKVGRLNRWPPSRVRKFYGLEDA